MKQVGVDQDSINKEIIAEKAIVEQLLSKEALNALDKKSQLVPDNYFNEFPTSVMEAIRNENKKARLVRITYFRKLAIAAAFLLTAATGYIFYEKSFDNNNEPTIVKIQELSNEEIENYVESNDLFVEAYWQTEINNTSAELESNTISINDDTNNLIN